MIKTDLLKYNNIWYKPGNSIKILIWYFVNVLIFQSHLFPINRLKIFILIIFGAKIGKGVIIKPGVNIKYPWFLQIGNHVWIGENVWIDNLAQVSIGNNACISQGALILNGNHNYKKSTFDLIVKDIVIEDGVWIGAKSIVCQGITCFSHAVLGVASVASTNLEAYSVYTGNPAVKIRDRIID
jgi:putative colanic acid biosynthesis acetyltransferase WcaF